MRTAATVADRTRSSGAWSPLAVPMFRTVWLATVVSNIGTWLSAVGTTWLMTLISPSPLMVTLVQAATNLPIFLFGLLAGALADIVDRRWLLIVVQVFTAIVAALLGVVTLLGWATPWVVLILTFLTGVGAALTAPAFQAIVPDLVPKSELKTAIALNGVGINVSRAIGPALAGIVIAAFGIAWTFLLNAASFLGVIAVFVRWNAPYREAHLPAERLVTAMRTGLRYARESPELRATMVRAAGFFLFASGYWALLPLVARDRLGGGAGAYSILLGCLGAGAIAGALLLPRIRARLSPDNLVLGASLGTAVVVTAFAFAPNLAVAVPLMLIAGALWITVLSTLNVSAQVALPAWVKARGLSVYLVVFNGGLALGSPVWGFVAGELGVAASLVVSAIALAAAGVLTLRWKLPPAEAPDLSPSMHWPAPLLAVDDYDARRGPVMVEVEYRIDPARREEFAVALEELGRIRRRDGAIFWRHFVDTADPARHVEAFLLESWLQHLRQHERVTVTDIPVQERVNAFQLGAKPPAVVHLVPDTPQRGNHP
ncbi:MAG: MFS transporter [Acidimicrobiia bacterium]|nr:MFS transporter [Acidimicrobiia bacterium]